MILNCVSGDTLWQEDVTAWMMQTVLLHYSVLRCIYSYLQKHSE